MNRILTILLMLVATTSCSTEKEKEIRSAPARFEVLEAFKAFPRSHKVDGKIIKDKVTGKCYLYLVYGLGNGGHSMVLHDCP